MVYHFAIIGGGILGLATAMTLNRRYSAARIVLLEKEDGPAQHQTGRNSGVIHSGIYYKPGSFKAKFARAGSSSIVGFCREHRIPHEICGKVIVATHQTELPRLEDLFQRGLQNGLAVRKVSPEEVREVEPHVRCLGGIRVPATGITNYHQISLKYLELFEMQGGTAKFGSEVRRVTSRHGVHVIETTTGEYETRFVINCAGLHSDRVTRMAGADPARKLSPSGANITNLPLKNATWLRH